MATTDNADGFTIEGMLRHLRENVESAAVYAKELASGIKDTVDRKAARRKREQLIAKIMERWVYANRDSIDGDREIHDLFVLLDVYDAQLEQLDAGRASSDEAGGSLDDDAR